MTDEKPKVEKEPVYAVYVGAGSFITGVPQRDMTRAEWEALPESWRQMGLDYGMYRIVED